MYIYFFNISIYILGTVYLKNNNDELFHEVYNYFYFYLVRDININNLFPNNLLFDFNHDKEINE